MKREIRIIIKYIQYCTIQYLHSILVSRGIICIQYNAVMYSTYILELQYRGAVSVHPVLGLDKSVQPGGARPGDYRGGHDRRRR